MSDFDDLPHALYRFFDGNGDLLYIGITWNIASRFPQHMDDKPWWGDIRDITIERYPDRRSVLEAEKSAIRAEHPRYNVTHKLIRPTPESDDAWSRLVRRVPELDLAAWWAGRQATRLRLHSERCCGLELWYGYGDVQPFVGDMGIRDLVTSLAGWSAGDRVWPEEAPVEPEFNSLSDFVAQEERPPGPKSIAWIPPSDLQRPHDDVRFVRQVITAGWEAPAALRTAQAYDAVYERFLTLMPECRACACVASAA